MFSNHVIINLNKKKTKYNLKTNKQTSPWFHLSNAIMEI